MKSPFFALLTLFVFYIKYSSALEPVNDFLDRSFTLTQEGWHDGPCIYSPNLKIACIEARLSETEKIIQQTMASVVNQFSVSEKQHQHYTETLNNLQEKVNGHRSRNNQRMRDLHGLQTSNIHEERVAAHTRTEDDINREKEQQALLTEVKKEVAAIQEKISERIKNRSKNLESLVQGGGELDSSIEDKQEWSTKLKEKLGEEQIDFSISTTNAGGKINPLGEFKERA